MKIIKYSLATFLLLFAVSVLSNTIRVPSQYATIQEAINNAQTGDTILVSDGIYEGEINFNGKDHTLIIKSESGPENCIIDCENAIYSSGFIFSSDDIVTIDGFTIRNAMMGINAYGNANPTIKNNFIENCIGGIVCFAGPNPIISGNIIRNCVNDGGGYAQYGGAISLNDCSASIINNIIVNNGALKGSGIYCSNSSPSIINNTIVGNSGIGTTTSNEEPILHCVSDQYNRISECYIPAAISAEGGGIYLNNSSPEIINNIVAFSKKSLEPAETSSGLTRWYYSSLFMHYNYEGAKLKSVTYYYGFKNNGETGDVHLYSVEKGGGSLDTTFTIQSGERYWMETTSFVSPSGDYGGLKLVAHIGTDSIGVNVSIDNPLYAGCYRLYDTEIQSFGISEDEATGTGIVAIGQNTFPSILYNDIYGNGNGNYIVGETEEEATLFNLTGVDGNVSFDPMLKEDYSLNSGSPCIDAGVIDTTGLGLKELDYFGNPRIFDGDGNGIAIIDIGAVEFQLENIETEEYISICQGEEYEGYTESTTFQRTLTSDTGLDSIVTTYLTVNPTYESEEFVSICEGEDYLGLTEEGDHQRDFASVNGCDSIVVTHLTVNAVYSSEESISICEGDNYLGLTEEGDHQREFESVNGCDSIIVTHLIVNPVYESEEYVSICQGDSYLDLTESGDYVRQLQTVNGCDSTVTTHLTVNPSYNFYSSESVCQPETFMGYSEPGQHTIYLQTENGCDSMVIGLTIHPSFTPTFTINGDTLISNEDYAQYQWCDESGEIAGRTGNKFVISQSGDYYLSAKNEGDCWYNSAIIFVRYSSSRDLKDNGFAYSVMPNPNKGEFTFRIDSYPPEKLSLKLINTLGQVIEIKQLDEPEINQTELFNLSHLSKGIYHLVIFNDNFMEDRKIVVQ